jgi:hypothetical protein
MDNAKKIIEDYLKFSGVHSSDEVQKFLNRANETKANAGSSEFFKIAHIRQQLTKAFLVALSQHNRMIDLVIDTGFLLKHENQQLGKFTDTGEVPKGGRQDNYWDKNKPKIQFQPKNTQVRKGVPLPPNFDLENEKFLLNYFAIHAVEYGQWLTQQDRVNYLAGCALALFDLHKVLNFHPQQIGLYGLISIAFGARGRGKAVGHFEPSTFAINMTRFKRPSKAIFRNENFDRSKMMFFSGGIGTFCHEFGHALDYYAGMFVEPAPHTVQPKQRKFWVALSFHKSIRVQPIKELMEKNSLRGKMERLLSKIIWKKNRIEHSDYYKRVLTETKKAEENTEYWIQRNELFARAFEVYVFNKMKQKGWHNMFMLRYKYDEPMYMTRMEFKSIEHEFDELIRALRSSIRSGIASIQRLPIYQKKKK